MQYFKLIETAFLHCNKELTFNCGEVKTSNKTIWFKGSDRLCKEVELSMQCWKTSFGFI